MKKIAYIGIKGLPSQAGADRVVEAIVMGLDKTEFQPVVYCSSQVVPEGTQIPGVEIVRIPVIGGKYLHAPTLFLLSALHTLFLGKYAFVHLHNVEASFIMPLLRLRYKVVSTSHGAAQTRDKWGSVAKLLIRSTEIPFVYLSNVITSVSKPLADVYEEQYGRSVHYIVNGVNQDPEFNLKGAKEVLQAHNIKEGSYLMFSAGRIIPSKGAHFVLDALSRIEDDSKLIIVGDPTHMPAYMDELHQMADDRVHFIDFVADKAVLFGLIKLSKLFVFPSTYEAMSMMLLEVASLCVPVLCSDIPENVSVLPQHARFFKTEDADDLHTQLVKALAEPQKMHELSLQAYEWVNKHHKWSNIVREYATIYETI